MTQKHCVRFHVVSLHVPSPHAACPNYQTELDSIYKKQDLKNIKNVKGCRDGMPKSMQTGYRNDIIVKVNLQSLIPASFSHQFSTVPYLVSNCTFMMLISVTVTPKPKNISGFQVYTVQPQNLK